MCTRLFRISTGLLFLFFTWVALRPLYADETLAIWLPNGFTIRTSEEVFVTPLFCEGNVATPCATEEDTLKNETFFQRGMEVDPTKVDFDEVELVADVKFCEADGSSCFTARNAHFRGNRVTELDSVVANLILSDFQEDLGFSQTIIEGGRAFQGAMIQHDPILCVDPEDASRSASGRFADVVCNGRTLEVVFRCESFVNFETGEFFAYGGGFTIFADD